ncbi:hypothetical protein SJAV_26950 [Sulfurisphaera javensis]|uniref:Uncharacterized protein n=1 Tax=Sulfurisphaera javensis TaxID=2049879 RepID=A0AAT9GVA5_9CREN
MDDVVPYALYEYLSKNHNVSKVKIREVYEKFYFDNEITAFDMGMSSLATLDYFLKRDIRRDLKRYYLISLFHTDMITRFILPGDLFAHYNPEDLIRLVECKPLLKFLSIRKRLSLGDLAKDLNKTKLIRISSDGSKEFTLALYFALRQINSRTYLNSSYIDSPCTAYKYLGCNLSIFRDRGFEYLHRSRFENISFEDTKHTLYLNVNPKLQIVAYNDSGFNRKYELRREGKYRVIKRI